MSSEPTLLDPDFEALLRDVAADPRSSLLRVERPRMLPELFDTHASITSQKAGLTSAERHLVQVHRGEVAWLLRQACLIKLIEGPRHRRYVSPYSGPGKKVQLLSGTDMARNVREREECSDDLECLSALELLNRCVADRAGEEPEVSELATASLRLEGSDQARLMVGLDLTNGGAPRSALRVLAHFVEGSLPDEQIAISFEYVGRAFTSIEATREAFNAYKHSTDTRAARVWSHFSRLVFSLQLGMKSEALLADDQLSDRVSHQDPAVDWYVRVLSEQRRGNEWHPTVAGAHLATELQESLSSVGRKIANALV